VQDHDHPVQRCCTRSARRLPGAFLSQVPHEVDRTKFADPTAAAQAGSAFKVGRRAYRRSGAGAAPSRWHLTRGARRRGRASSASPPGSAAPSSPAAPPSAAAAGVAAGCRADRRRSRRAAACGRGRSVSRASAVVRELPVNRQQSNLPSSLHNRRAASTAKRWLLTQQSSVPPRIPAVSMLAAHVQALPSDNELRGTQERRSGRDKGGTWRGGEPKPPVRSCCRPPAAPSIAPWPGLFRGWCPRSSGGRPSCLPRDGGVTTGSTPRICRYHGWGLG